MWLVCWAAVACGDAPPAAEPVAPAPLGTPERVHRLEPEGDALEEITAAGETRRARVVSPPSRTRICAAEAPGVDRVLSLGLRADVAGVSVHVKQRDAEPITAAVALRWSELRVPLPPAARCLEVGLAGPAEARVAASVPVLEHAGDRRPWVVLYVVDTLRFDATPWGGAPDEVAPAFTAFARDAVLYRNALSVTSWTRPAVATLLTGLGPAYHGVFDRQDRLAGGLPRLPERLAEAGWATAAVSTNPNVLPLWGFLAGFDRFVDVEADGWTHRQGLARLGPTVDAIVTRAVGTPLFLYVHDNGPHAGNRKFRLRSSRDV
jgi:hypothetical protein